MGFFLFATKFPEWFLLRLITTPSYHLSTQQRSVKLWGDSALALRDRCPLQKTRNPLSSLLAKAIREWVVSIWVRCREASLGGRQEAAKLPFRNKIEFNLRNSYCISVMFTAVKWVLQGRQKRRKRGCLLQGACNQRCSLLKKGREARRKRSHICCPAKIILHPPYLLNYNLQT